MIAGVCGGLGQYLRIDATLIRLFFVLLALGSGVGVALYVIMWVVVPYEEEGAAGANEDGANEIAQRIRSMGNDVRQAFRQANPKTGLVIGGALIILGIVFLGQTLNLVWLRWLRFDVMWPLLLIVIGGLMIWRRSQHD